MRAGFQASGYRWTILGVASFSFLSSWIPRVMYSPLVEEVRRELQLSYTESGLLMSGFWLGYLLAQVPSGYISDRIGVRRTHTFSLAAVGAFCFLTGLSSSFIECLTYRFLDGLACGFIFAPGVALVLRWFPPGDRALAIGAYSAAASGGMVLAFAASPLIAEALGSWRWSFWLLSLPAFAAALPTAFMVVETPHSASRRLKPPEAGMSLRAEAAAKPPLRSILSILKSREMWLLCLVMVGLSVASLGILTWTPTYLEATFNLSATAAGSIMSLNSTISTMSGPTAGFIADRLLKRRVPLLYAAILFKSIGCIALATLPGLGFYPIIAIFITATFFGSMGFSLDTPILSQWFPLEIIGTASGFLNSVGGIGGALGPWIYGATLEATGSFTQAWLTLGLIGLALSLAAIPLIRRERKA